jgi:DNA ligase-associated metallophosphoesterase
VEAVIEKNIAGQTLSLLADRALFWQEAKTLFVADVHFGKAAHFRAEAVAVPGGSTTTDINRLSSLLNQTGAVRLVVLGDLIHSRKGRSPATFKVVRDWRQEHADVEMILVRGNHDARSGDPPADWQIKTVSEPFIDGPFALCHHPQASTIGYVLSGHIHPSALLVGYGGLKERLPCFLFRADHAILPAFGSLTGLGRIDIKESDDVFVIAEGEVIEVSKRGAQVAD